MSPATPPKSTSHVSGEILARIEAQSLKFIEPLRDFLVSFGCEVVVNQRGRAPGSYHIVCGDTDFVKEIFSSLQQGEEKRLAIITDGHDGDEDAFTKNAKVIFIDEATMTQELVGEIFHFFFTSRSKFRDARKNPKKQRPGAPGRSVKDMPHVKKNGGESDSERIGSIIESVFSKDQQLKPQRIHFSRRATWISIVVLLLSPFLWYMISLFSATLTVASGALLLRSGRGEFVIKTAPIARFWISQSRNTLQFIGVPISLFHEKIVYEQEKYISFVDHLSSSIWGASSVFIRGKSLAIELMALVSEEGRSPSPAAQVEKLRVDLYSVQNNLGLAQAQLHSLIESASFPFWMSFIRRFGEAGEKTISRYRQTILSADKFLLLYPRVAGFSTKQVYLVLLQNSLELRPTGGFIGSIAVVTTEDGKVADITIRDVYELDGQLKGHVDPPLPIRELLGQEHWYLRDSNWDPDFRKSAAQSAWFYEKETGERVDGVVAISTPFIVDLLSVTGPLTLSDYNDRITSQNFYGKSLYYTQENFFPGSTQKKDFLGSLARTLIETITSSKNLNPVFLFRVITHAFEGRDLMIYFPNEELEGIVKQFGWAGDVFAKTGCEGVTSCLFDPVFMVEANLGVNKVNYFISRELTRAVSISENGEISEKITADYVNTSVGQPGDSGGDYRLHTRVLLPKDSNIGDIFLNGVSIPYIDPQRKKLLSLPSAEYEKETGILSIAAVIAAQSRGQITIEYTRGAQIQFSQGKAIYEFFMQKQPGVSDAPIAISLTYPSFWRVVDQKGFLAKEGLLEYNNTLSQDIHERFEFRK